MVDGAGLPQSQTPPDERAGTILAVPSPDAGSPALLLDLDRYPVEGEGRADLVVTARAMLERDGIVVLPGFLRPAALAALVAEAERLVPDGHFAQVENTPYLALPDDAFPDGHPRCRLVRSALTAVAYDRFGTGSTLRALYEWPPLARFVRDVVGLEEIHPYADPLGALNVAAMSDGDELGWHFDQTDFVTSLAVQSPESGGDFEVARRLRTVDDERYEEVAAVLNGGRTAVTHVVFQPGALMIFAGRHSMHRVTPVVGPTPRYVALLAYDSHPGTDSSDLLKLVRYGRLPEGEVGDVPGR